jgi:hypothetical protein
MKVNSTLKTPKVAATKDLKSATNKSASLNDTFAKYRILLDKRAFKEKARIFG